MDGLVQGALIFILSTAAANCIIINVSNFETEATLESLMKWELFVVCHNRKSRCIKQNLDSDLIKVINQNDFRIVPFIYVKTSEQNHEYTEKW